MHKEIIEFNQAQRTRALPELRAGDTVRIHRKIVEEGKERIQAFEGLIIAIKGNQSSSPTLTVRKNSFGVGVELIIPLHSPNIEKLELVKRAKVRHSKIYFVRDKSDRELKRKLRDIKLSEDELSPKTSETPEKKEDAKEDAVAENAKETEEKKAPKKEVEKKEEKPVAKKK